MRGLLAFVAFGLAASTTLTAGEVKQVVRVHLSGQTGLKPKIEGPEKDALHGRFEQPAKASALEAERLEKEIRAQHGKDRERWPLDKRTLLDQAEQVAGDARTKYLYAAADQESIDGTIWDLTKEADKKEGLALVSNPDEADLLVKVIGRRGSGMLKISVCLEIAPGARLDKDALAAQEITWPWSGARGAGVGPGGVTRVDVLHAYSREEPFWRVEVEGKGAAKKYAGYFGAKMLEKFAEMNSKALDAARTSVSTP
jgi:hypothetical protein